MVNINYYYALDGEEKCKSVECDLKPSNYWTMIEAAKINHGEKTDFGYLEETSPTTYEEVMNLVKATLTQKGIQVGTFCLKEFPYQVLANAM